MSQSASRKRSRAAASHAEVGVEVEAVPEVGVEYVHDSESDSSCGLSDSDDLERLESEVEEQNNSLFSKRTGRHRDDISSFMEVVEACGGKRRYLPLLDISKDWQVEIATHAAWVRSGPLSKKVGWVVVDALHGAAIACIRGVVTRKGGVYSTSGADVREWAEWGWVEGEDESLSTSRCESFADFDEALRCCERDAGVRFPAGFAFWDTGTPTDRFGYVAYRIEGDGGEAKLVGEYPRRRPAEAVHPITADALVRRHGICRAHYIAKRLPWSITDRWLWSEGVLSGGTWVERELPGLEGGAAEKRYARIGAIVRYTTGVALCWCEGESKIRRVVEIGTIPSLQLPDDCRMAAETDDPAALGEMRAFMPDLEVVSVRTRVSGSPPVGKQAGREAEKSES